MASPFIIERSLNAPRKRVWRAITNKDDMKKWYFDLPEFTPEVGFEFQFTGGQEGGIQYLHRCRVTEVIPEKKITYSWRYEGYEGMSHVTFELFDEGDQKTKIKLTHTGLDTFPKDNPDFDAKNFEAGWTEIIGTHLKNFVEQ